MKLRSVAAAFALSLVFSVAAQASSLNDSKVGSARSELAAQVRHSTDVVRFFTVGPGSYMVAARHSSCAGVAWRATCARARRIVAAHRWLLSVASLRLRALERPSHYDGWMCIHAQEGGFDANTGNGYYGGWQAHLNWYGVERMDLLSAMDQMHHVDAVAAKHGYSWSFMHGQWPNTYPPCAKFF